MLYLTRIVITKVVEVYLDAPDQSHLDDEVADYANNLCDGCDTEHEIIHYIDNREEDYA